MGIPLLALQGTSQPDPLRQAGEAMQLKALQGQIAMQPGQLQLQQQQIEAQKRQLDDATARTAALREWSENPGTIPQSELPNLILKHGGSADAWSAMNQQVIAQQTAIQKLKKDELDNAQAHATAIGARAQAVLNVSPENMPQADHQAKQELLQAGIISPQEAAQPFDLDSLRLHAAAAMNAKDQIDTELKRRETAAQELAAQARMTQANKPPQEVTDIADYTKTYLSAKGLPDTPSNQLLARDAYYKVKQPFGAQKIQIEQGRADLAERAANQKDTDFIDKTYVKPANDVEQGYQKFLDARKDYDAGAKTGAASMVALSQHLSTTFGSVKGSRLNKDLIAEHKDAIGWTDQIQRFGEKIQSGQQLSKDQWDDFQKLITNTRNISWNIAQKEAKRRGVDISDSLPDDIKGGGTATNAKDPLGIR